MEHYPLLGLAWGLQTQPKPTVEQREQADAQHHLEQ